MRKIRTLLAVPVLAAAIAVPLAAGTGAAYAAPVPGAGESPANAAVTGNGPGAHAAAVTPAYAPAFNEKYTSLDTPAPVGGDSAYVQRSIYLAAGCYARNLFLDGPDGQTYSAPMYLSAGWYFWQDVLTPEPAGPLAGGYSLDDWLTGTDPATEPSEWSGFFVLNTGGTYLWGGGLTWVRATC
jgi:hypothetical protein